jgi:hypothetical protein
MGETSYYPPTSSPRQQGNTAAPGPVLLAVAGPAAQRRATVAIRLILVIPHLLALYFLGIAAFVVAVIGWLSALVIGRLPGFAATYLADYLRWYSRVGAYLLLLTDEYPPFAYGDAGYPVRLAVGSGRLNRLTVLFRIILAIPAAIMSTLLTSGFTIIVVFIAWLTALIAGRLPTPLHQAFAAVLRYTIRNYGYLYLLTGDYPAGLFGDQPVPQPDRGLSYGTPWLPGQQAPEDGTSGQDASWQLALSPGAKRLVGLILALGLLTAAGEGAWIGATINAARVRDREITQLNTAVAQFNGVVVRHNAAVAQEQQAAGQLDNDTQRVSGAHETFALALNAPNTDDTNCSTVSCFNVTALPVAQAFAAFGRALRAVPLPSGSTAIANRLSTDTAGNEQDWTEITQADSFTSVENIATAAEKVGGQFDNDYAALMTSLSNAASTFSNESATLNNAATTLNHEGAILNQRATALNVPVGVRSANGAL